MPVSVIRAKGFRSCSGTRPATLVVVLTAAALGWTRGVGAADREAASRDEELIVRWNDVYEDIHDSLAFTIIRDSKERPALTSKLVLSQYNPSEVQGVRHGRIYVWSADGKPAVVGGIWSIPDRADRQIRKICYEFHSLSQQPVMLEKNGIRIWRCDQPGVQWQQHRGIETPAARRTARLVQMRRIADSYKTDVRFRLLPQPIYRYLEKAGGVTDGAVFAYTAGTDPQIFLLLEAKDDRWYVAFARSNKNPRQVTYKDEIVWSVERMQANREDFIRSNSAPFFLHHIVERRFADNPESVQASQR